MSILSSLKADPRPWLLEEDEQNPGVRLLTLRELEGKPENDPQVEEAQRKVMQSGPVAEILAHQHTDGYWEKQGPGYLPKYRSTVWSLSFLAQLGADGREKGIQKACDYLLEHARAPYGGFSMNGNNSGLIHCLQGNLCAAMLDFGLGEDERLQQALDWLARSISGEGIAPAGQRDADPFYLRSGNSGPGFSCSANLHQGCAWGAVKAMLALGKIPAEKRSAAVNTAIQMGIDFLLCGNPARAEYPTAEDTKPSQSWFRFGFPLFYVTDVLQNLEVLTALGVRREQGLDEALELLLDKQGSNGRWSMEYTYNGKTWVNIEEKKKPSKWVTLRVLRVFRNLAEL